MELVKCARCAVDYPPEDYRLTYPKTLASGKTVRYRLKTCKHCLNKDQIKPEDRARKAKIRRDLRAERKRKVIAHFGDSCGRCGGVFPACVYDFHHIDPAEKDADPGLLLGSSEERMWSELEKCTMLCANCHRIVHNE